jgi:hypothetical protein
VKQLEALPVVEDLVRVQVRLLASPRLQRRVLSGTGDEEDIVRVGVESNDGNGESGLVILKVELEDGLSL